MKINGKINFPETINLIIVFLLAVVFFIGTASFNYLTQDKNYVKWSSPDETANYFFSKKLSQTGQLAFFDPAATLGDNIVIPRSLRSDEGWLKPVSFLGIILIYGFIASIFSIAVIPYLTPFFAALGIIIFYLLVKNIFKNSRIALLSAFLLATFPVYIYYSARSMFHNVLFVVLLLIGAYLSVLALGAKKEKIKIPFLTWNLGWKSWLEMLAAVGAGIFIGLAIITRTSELLWLAPAALIIYLFYARRIGITKGFLFLAGLFLALLPVAYWNQILYTSPFYGGYNAMNSSLIDLSKSGSEIIRSTFSGRLNQYAEQFKNIAHNIFYFGFNAKQSILMFRHYILEMFSVLLYSGLFGLLILFVSNCRRFKKKYLVYVLVWGAISVILIFYYGSWKFNDNPNPNSFTIGNSYTRYWLPIYLMLLPLVSLAVVRLSRALLFITSKSKDRIRPLIAGGLQAVAIIIISTLSLIFVLYGSEEGIAFLYYNNLAERTNAEKVFSLTDPQGIIITRYYDKFFFPERRVIMGTLPNDEILTATAKLVTKYPVYYYNFFLDEAAVQYLNERKFAPYKLEMKLVNKVNSKFGLYQLNKVGVN